MGLVQFIFCFWSFEISRNILGNQKYYRFSRICSKQTLAIRTLFECVSVFGLTALLNLEITVSLWLSSPIHSGSLKRIDYSITSVCSILFLLNVVTALKEFIFIFLAHLSRRLIGELIGYSWSGVRPSVHRPSLTISNIFSKTAYPIKAKFYVEPP